MKKILLIIAGLAVLYMVGLAGASDMGTITFEQLGVRCLVAGFVFSASMGGAMTIEKYQFNKERRK